MEPASTNMIRTGPDEGALIVSLRSYFDTNPDKTLSEDSVATAKLQDDFRCEVSGPYGSVQSDMPKGLGGLEVAPSPGWFMRAAVASCCATAIALRAAELDLALSHLEVRAESTSDGRGMLGMGEVPAGPLQVTLSITVSAPHATTDEVTELINYASLHAPVGDALESSTRIETVVEIIEGD